MSKPEPRKTSTEELRALLEQEAGRWSSANIDANALRLILYGIGRCHGDRNEPLWFALIVTINKVEELAALCGRYEELMRQQLAALGAVAGDTAAEQLH